MNYINYIDEIVNTKIQKNNVWVIARQHQGHGLLWLEIRLRMAWACLTGKADAVRFHEDN